MLAVSKVKYIGVDELWIAFGTGKHFRYLATHEIAAQLGPQKTTALPMFHAVTGCDTVSFFSGKGKITAWDVWTVFPEITDVFAGLATAQEISDDAMAAIERFVVLLYSRTSTAMLVNKARQELFSRNARTLESIPPTQAAPFTAHKACCVPSWSHLGECTGSSATSSKSLRMGLGKGQRRLEASLDTFASGARYLL